MSASRPTRRPIVLCSLAALTLGLAARPALAIVIRHDRDDARYVALGERFPAAATVLPDGTGTLIAPEWVLTAGHVARGVAARSSKVEVAGREYGVTRAFVHPEWREMGPHDVGLLRLEHPVEAVTPAELYAGRDEVGQQVTFVGRGDTGTGLTGPRDADRQQRGATNEVDAADDDWIFFDFDEGDGATDLEGVSGPGDSGGPAFVTRDGKLYTLGVSVFADGQGKGPGRYGVREGYARVSTHRDWIASIVSGESTAGEVAVGGGGPPAGGARAERRAVHVAADGPAELPGSPLGALAGKYVEAYNSASDEKMKAFMAASFAESLRAKRTEQEHVALYRRLYDELFGPLRLDRVVEVEDAALTLLFASEKGPMAEFRFEAGEGEERNRIAGIRVGVVQIAGGP